MISDRCTWVCGACCEAYVVEAGTLMVVCPRCGWSELVVDEREFEGRKRFLP